MVSAPPERPSREAQSRLLSKLSKALSESSTLASALDGIGPLLVPGHCEGAFIDLLQPEGAIRRVWAHHERPDAQKLLIEIDRRFPKNSGDANPMFDAIRTGRSGVFHKTSEEGLARASQGKGPEYVRLVREIGWNATVLARLSARGRIMGVMAFMGRPGQAFGPEDIAFHEEIADRMALFLDNVRQFQELEERGGQFRMLAEASRMLASSIDYEETLGAVARMAVPEFADWCAVDLLGPEGKLRRLAVAHKDPEKVAWAYEIHRKWPPDLRPTQGLGLILAKGVSQIMEDIPRGLLDAAARDEEHLQTIRALDIRSYVGVPLKVGGKPQGVITFIRTGESDKLFRAGDLELAEELARRAGLAIEHARLFSEEKAAIRQRDEFLSIASHELKTPLTSLSLHLQMLLRFVNERELPDNARSKLESATKQARRLGSLVDMLLDVSRLAAGRLELQIEDVDVVAMTRELVSRFEVDARRAGCEVALEAPAELTGSWDRLRLEQAVSNLLSNALKYGAGHPVGLRLWREGTGVCLSVSDQGIGISGKDRDRIFDRFERAVTDDSVSGLGLGLFVTRQIAEAHGGSIAVDSEPGKGSVFTLILPASTKSPAKNFEDVTGDTL